MSVPLFRIKDHPHLAAAERRLRTEKLLRQYATDATIEAQRLGHRIGRFEPDHPSNTSAVTTCRDCGRIAAIDIGSRLSMTGTVYRAPCGQRLNRTIAADDGLRSGDTSIPVHLEGKVAFSVRASDG